ncbi:porin [Burkholderia sp. USMB20]|uniref:porin n=1 Tax=Burkholderia sp. USMB20 TaxID=1571773 RepID=UPI001F440389|nr:porin [Burkholderia sp. USMB20]
MQSTMMRRRVRLLTASIAVAAVCDVQIPAAHAQSTVTLYGLLSEGIGYVSNEGGKSNIKLIPGTLQNNRIGLKGSEDLGDGWKAIFTLENGFDVTNGKFQQGGRMFGRQAFVGLASAKWGTLTAGRQYDAVFDYLTGFEAAVVAAGLGAHIGDNDNVFGSYRQNNSIKYQTPVIAGLRAEVLYALSNAAGQWAVNRTISAGLSYERGGWRFAAAFLNMDRPGVGGNAGGAVTDDYAGAPFVLFHASPLNPSIGVRRQREFGAGGQYSAGTWRVAAMATDVRYDYLDGTSLRLDNFDVNGSYYLMPDLMVSAAYIYTSGKYGGGYERAPHWNAGQLSIDYFLSKRTDLYLYGNYQKAAGATADIYLFAPSSSQNQTAIVAGIRHKF